MTAGWFKLIAFAFGLIAAPLVEQTSATENPKRNTPGIKFLEQAEAISAATTAAAEARLKCDHDTAHPWRGLRVDPSEGLVRDAAILGDMTGFAKEAETTGGLNGRLYVVTDARDYDPRTEPVVAGSFRAQMERIRASHGPGWVVFDPRRFRGETEIFLRTNLEVPNNTTIDGSCSSVRLTGVSNRTLLFLNGAQNVIIVGLALSKLVYNDESAKSQDCITVYRNFDRIWIAFNDFGACGDGSSDITHDTAADGPSRITVSFNRYQDNNKVMLIGALACYEPKVRTAACDRPTVDAFPPRIWATVHANYFRATGTRHPRVFANAYVDVVGNLISWRARRYAEGGLPDTSGIFVGTGGRALIRDNIFAALDDDPKQARLGVWTVLRGYEKKEPFDQPGWIRLMGNVATSDEVLLENLADAVTLPPYALVPSPPPDAKNKLTRAACLISMAGRRGLLTPSRC